MRFEHDGLFASFLSDVEEKNFHRHSFFNLGLSLVERCLSHFAREKMKMTSERVEHFHEITEKFSAEIDRLWLGIEKQSFQRLPDITPQLMFSFYRIGNLNAKHEKGSGRSCDCVHVEACHEAIELFHRAKKNGANRPIPIN